MTVPTLTPTSVPASMRTQKVKIDFQWQGDVITARIDPSLLRLEQDVPCEVTWEVAASSVADVVKISHAIDHWPFDDHGSPEHLTTRTKPYVARSSKPKRDRYHYVVEGKCTERRTGQSITVIVDPDIVVD